MQEFDRMKREVKDQEKQGRRRLSFMDGQRGEHE
jgi:hypothetical protein